MKSKSHRKIERPLADPIYRNALTTYEKTGVWPKLRRSGKLPEEVVKEKKRIEERLKERNIAKFAQFFKSAESDEKSHPSEQSTMLPASLVTSLVTEAGVDGETTAVIEDGINEREAKGSGCIDNISSESVIDHRRETLDVGVQTHDLANRTRPTSRAQPYKSLANAPPFNTFKWIRQNQWLDELARPLPCVETIFGNDLFLWNPEGGRCVSCDSSNLMHTSKLSNEKIIYNFNKVYVAQTTRVVCSSCGRTFYKWDQSYIITLPLRVQMMIPFVCGGKGLDYEVVHHARRALMGGGNLSQVVGNVRASLNREYELRRRRFVEKWDSDMRNPFIKGKPEEAPAPPDNVWLPSYDFLLAMMLRDLLLEKKYLARELAGIVGNEGGSLGIDCQRKVARKVAATHVSGQTCTIISDFGAVLSCGLVPSTSVRYAAPLVSEVFRRYDKGGISPPRVFYVDCNCCSESGESAWANHLPDATAVRLDVFHIITRLLRASNQSHSLSGRLSKDLGRAFLAQDVGDAQALERARVSLGIQGAVPKADRLKHIRRYVPERTELRSRVDRVIQAYYQSDLMALEEWEKEKGQRESEPSTSQLSSPPIGSRYQPLLGEDFFSTYKCQLTHIDRNCVSDLGSCMSQVNTIGYRGSSIQFPVYRANRGTSRVECFHSIMQRSFNSFSRVGSCLFDLKLWWIIHKINRRGRIKCGLRIPAEDVSPREFEEEKEKNRRSMKYKQKHDDVLTP